MVNKEIRTLLFQNNIKHFNLAHQLGICESTLSRWLRVELSKEKKAEIIFAINKLVEKGEETED